MFTREPGGTEFGAVLRKALFSDEAEGADPAAVFDVFWADRRNHWIQVILPALKAGKMVITDRSEASTFAYQVTGEQHGSLRSEFLRKRTEIIESAGADILYIILDGRPEVFLARGDDPNHFERRPIEYHHRVRDGYREFAQLVESRTLSRSISRCVFIDAEENDAEQGFNLACKEISV